MPNEKLRRRLAYDAARLIYTRQESDPYRATLRAARAAVRGWLKPSEFPSETEIRLHLQKMSWMHEGDARFDNLREVRLEALRLMRLLEDFSPRLVGNAVSGAVRRLRQIDLRVFVNDGTLPAPLVTGLRASESRLVSLVRGGRRIPVTIWTIPGPIPVRLSVWPSMYARRAFRHRPTSRRRPQASLRQLNSLILRDHPDAAVSDGDFGNESDRFQVYRMLLAPLAGVEQSRRRHPEGDALYHSLQVFELARGQLPYDEEFLLAALLHDVGKSLDPLNHVEVGLAALNGHITDRTSWLISNHTDAHRLLEGTLGQRARRRLMQAEDYNELLLLARCDRAGRVPGGEAPDLDSALEYIRGVVRMCEL